MTESATATKDPNNYYFILSENRFIYAPTRSLVERSAVQRQIGGEATKVVEEKRVCSNLTWFPGLPSCIKDKVIVESELEDSPGNNLFNLYRAPRPLKASADPAKAKFWLDLGEKLFGEHHARLLDCLAFKVQHPERKINRGIVLGSYDQGVGKDAFLWPVRRAVGAANWRTKGASAILTNIERNFTPFLRSTILQISEVHEMNEKRFSFYDSIKDWCAAPPGILYVADKNVKEYPILNTVLPFFTTNHLTDGLYIPPEDRRIDHIWSQRVRGDFSKEYWDDYWLRVKENGEDEHVAAYLMTRDVSKFAPGEAPPKTASWYEVVNANRDPGDSELIELLTSVGRDLWFDPRPPRAVTIEQLRNHPTCPRFLHDLFSDNGKRRIVAHRLGAARYGAWPNPDRADGRWKIQGRAQTVYTPTNLPGQEKTDAVNELIQVIEQEPAPAPEENEFA